MMFLLINLLKPFYKITSMANSQFNPALPLPMSFKIQDGKFGMQLGIFIPTESITHLIDHLQNLVNTKPSSGSVYLGKEKGTKKTTGIYLNAKVLDGEYGQYGQINPQKIENAPNTEGLF